MMLMVFDTPEEKGKFEQAYLRYNKVGFYYAREILHDDALAEDALHDAFLSLARNLDKIGDVECSKSFNYFVTIVKNTAISTLRRQKRARTVNIDDDSSVFQLEDSAPGPEESSAQKDSYTRLLNAVKRLKPEYQAPLLLKYANGYTEAEIAKTLGITVSNVSVRIYRAKQKLIPILRAKGGDDFGQAE